MTNPFSRIADVVRDMSRTIGYETVGNFVYERLFGGTVPEDKSGGKPDKDKKEGSEGSELQTAWGFFNKKDEAALAGAMGKLAEANGLAHDVMSDRISHLGLFGIRALRAIIALNKDEEARVTMLENWAKMDDQQWKVHMSSIGLDSVERFWAFLQRLWAQAKRGDQSLAARIQKRMEATQQNPNQLSLFDDMNEISQAQPVVIEPMSQPPVVEVPMSRTAKVWVAILIALMAAFGLGPLFLGW